MAVATVVSEMSADKSEFSSVIRSLLEGPAGAMAEMPLVPTAPRESPQLEILRSMSADDLFGVESVDRRDHAECVRAGLYLYFSALDESHAISQRISTATGSYWHGIMHRQEGDWSNAKYWFRRVGTHPVYADLESETGESWDPFQFVDDCAAAASGRAGRARALALQTLEWRLLMRHCYRQALGL